MNIEPNTRIDGPMGCAWREFDPMTGGPKA